MLSAIRRLLAVVFLSIYMFTSQAQSVKEVKPYKILTSGKQVTIKSTKNISNVMLWTNNGNRLVEQREINDDTYSFTIPVNGKFFFLMVGLANGKIYTEKLGIRE